MRMEPCRLQLMQAGIPVLTALAVFSLPQAVMAAPAVALTASNELISFDTTTPATLGAPLAISGLLPSENLLGIDFRPATQQLFGLGRLGQLYAINATTGVATAVGAPLDPTTVPLAGNAFGFDFNPAVDRIRVTSDLGENLRLNPNDGTLVANDTELAFAATDANAAALPTVTASAYTNNDTDPATGTLLYGLDSALGILVTQAPPNDGTLNTIGSLGLGADTPLFAGFDIGGTANNAFALTSFEPPLGSLPALNATLYSVNLSTGAAISLGLFGDGSTPLAGFSLLVPEPASLAAMGGLLLAAGCRRRSR